VPRVIGLVLLGFTLAWLPNPTPALAAGRTFPLFPYWADGHELTWYNFGARSPAQNGRVAVQPVWLITAGPDAKGQPAPLVGQGAIFDVDAGEPGYSDLWRVVWVQAPAGYQPNGIRSLAQIEQAGLPQTPTDTYINCPFVGEDDRLARSGDAPRRGWVRGRPVSYCDLGATQAVTGRMWRFASGSNAQGQPRFVDGQYTVSDSTPAAFREVFLVQVPPGYKANSITTVAQVRASGYPVRPLNQTVNVPLPPPSDAPANGGSGTGRYGVVAALSAAWLGCAAYLLRQPRPNPSLAPSPGAEPWELGLQDV
jgi:hypothetical protein